jgi:hypothetical protein
VAGAIEAAAGFAAVPVVRAGSEEQKGVG